MKRLNGKVFAAVMVAVLLAAGSAFAWGGKSGFQGQNQGQGKMYGQGQAWNQGPRGQYFANPGQKGGWNMHSMMGSRDSRFAGRHFMMGGGDSRFAGRHFMMGGGDSRFAGRHFMMGGRSSGFTGGRNAMGGMGSRGGIWNNVEIPQEIRDKQAEMGKLSIEMRNEMWKKPMDRAKVEELFKKQTALGNELSEWRMKTCLDTIEKLQK